MKTIGLLSTVCQKINKPISSTLIELTLLFIFVFAYSYGITILARQSFLFEAIIVILVPCLIYYIRYNQAGNVKINIFGNRVLQLLFIESIFLVFVLITKISIFCNLTFLNKIMNINILLFMIAQASLFIIYQKKVKSYFGLIRSVLMLILLCHWFHTSDTISIIDEQGRFLFWGSNAPDLLIVYYCVWIIGVPLVDSVALPNFRQSTPQFASVAIAALSGEFFHSRLLTACHLFALDYAFEYSKEKKPTFGVITHDQQLIYDKSIRPILDITTLIGCITIFLIYLNQ